jgi:hypothetical protein
MTTEQMKNTDIRSVDPSALVNRQNVHIDKQLPRDERLKQYISQIKNPYCYLDGDVVVKVSFKKCDETIEDRLRAYIRSF